MATSSPLYHDRYIYNSKAFNKDRIYKVIKAEYGKITLENDETIEVDSFETFYHYDLEWGARGISFVQRDETGLRLYNIPNYFSESSVVSNVFYPIENVKTLRTSKIEIYTDPFNTEHLLLLNPNSETPVCDYRSKALLDLAKNHNVKLIPESKQSYKTDIIHHNLYNSYQSPISIDISEKLLDIVMNKKVFKTTYLEKFISSVENYSPYFLKIKGIVEVEIDGFIIRDKKSSNPLFTSQDLSLNTSDRLFMKVSDEELTFWYEKTSLEHLDIEGMEKGHFANNYMSLMSSHVIALLSKERYASLMLTKSGPPEYSNMALGNQSEIYGWLPKSHMIMGDLTPLEEGIKTGKVRVDVFYIDNLLHRRELKCKFTLLV